MRSRLLLTLLAFAHLLATGCSATGASNATNASTRSTAASASREQPRMTTGSFIPQRPGQESTTVRSAGQEDFVQAQRRAGY